ncbi:TIGR04141 family sporadically distributed protein [Methanobrevibacter sp. UBA337]|jgi:uncharacterized protein (TIGR04141 family)|uniref:TIGR04141 family sporadically distributed protein n=1 Tax=Methanobrevibacter sp. UBA337 TaxID=1915480 RepID=UPI0039B97667
MVKLNLYKINSINDLESYLNENYECVSNEERISTINKDLRYELYLYCKYPKGKNKLSWSWIFSAFGKDLEKKFNKPIEPKLKAIILIKYHKISKSEYEDEGFAFSFGHAYHDLYDYTNKNWALNLANRLNYHYVKKISLNKPSSKNIQRTNFYTNYENFDFNTGDVLKDFRAEIDTNNLNSINDISGCELNFTGDIEIGNSLKVTIKWEDLNSIVKLLDFLDYIAVNESEKQDFPISKDIEDKTLIRTLNHFLYEELISPNLVNDSNLEVSEYFCNDFQDFINGNYSLFYIFSDYISSNLDSLNVKNLKEFINKKNISEENFEKIEVSLYNEEITIKTRNLKDFIYYNPNNEDHNEYFLINGAWIYFNPNYIEDLKKHIDKIDIKYQKEYDFCSKNFKNYYLLEKENSDKSDFPNFKSFCTEGHFNEYLSKCHGFKCFHEENYVYGNSTIEVMDLYKDKTMYIVKMGGSSSKLCYAIDQSLMSIEYLEDSKNLEKTSGKNDKKLPNDIENVCLWLIFERENPFTFKDEHPNLNEYNGILFKQKLVFWDQEVRLKRYNTQIMVNYKSKNKLDKFSNLNQKD